MAWSRLADSCINCGTQDRPHRGKGFCTKCHGPARTLAAVQAWDVSRPETIREYPSVLRSTPRGGIPRLQRGLIAELQQRLDMLKMWESARHDSHIDTVLVESQLGRIASLAGAQDRNLFHGYAGYLGSHFDHDGLLALRRILVKIEEDRPWQLNWYRVFTRDDG
jgi:hypothetical protein